MSARFVIATLLAERRQGGVRFVISASLIETRWSSEIGRFVITFYK
jgi:hypothetical protein